MIGRTLIPLLLVSACDLRGVATFDARSAAVAVADPVVELAPDAVAETGGALPVDSAGPPPSVLVEEHLCTGTETYDHAMGYAIDVPHAAPDVGLWREAAAGGWQWVPSLAVDASGRVSVRCAATAAGQQAYRRWILVWLD